MKKLFRKSMFGGFRKKDVEEYVNELEKELEKLRAERDEGLEMIRQQKQDREMIKKVLSDAEEQAEKIVRDAERSAEEKARCAKQELRNELNNRVIEFMTVKYHLAEFSQGIDELCDQLKGVSESVRLASEELTAKVDSLAEIPGDSESSEGNPEKKLSE